MDQSTSPSPYPNPYAAQPPVQSDTGFQGGPNAQQPQVSTSPARAVTLDHPAPEKKTNWIIAIVLLIVGLVVGGIAGFFIGDLLVFQGERDTFAAERTQLEQRITVLEGQAIASATSSTGATTPGTTTQGTGTATTQSGITADPQTATWSTYANTQYKFSFKYPADYQVKEETLAAGEKDILFQVGVYRVGGSTPVASVYVYKGPTVEGAPTTRDITLYGWPSTLPTTIAGVPAGAGVAPGVTTTTTILNGGSVVKLKAVEGKQTTPTPGGKEYEAYFVEDVFTNSYLLGTCTQGQTEEEQVACSLLTTFEITR